MFTEVDERDGLVRTTWDKVRKRVAKVEPTFAKLVDQISPGKKFPLYLAYLPYGVLKGDQVSTLLPRSDGTSFRVSDKDTPSTIAEDLGYSINTSPFGMVLEKNFEYFIDLPQYDLTIPKAVYLPGRFFSLSRNLSSDNRRIYSSNAALTVSAGARSIFMLPNIGCNIHQNRLKKDFDITLPAAKKLYHHWDLFKALLNSELVSCDWRACLIYFSKTWIDKIHTDPAWLEIRSYLYEKAWTEFAYERNRSTYDTEFSLIQKENNLKPNPYLADTARHILALSVGALPGHTPAINEDSAPIYSIQKIFLESYRLKKYLPTLMEPAHLSLEKKSDAIYYSLQNPTTLIFSPTSRTSSSTMFEMRELQHLLGVFLDKLSQNRGLCKGTILNLAAKTLTVRYFHNQKQLHKSILPSAEAPAFDYRFNTLYGKASNGKEHGFSKDSKFFRGCLMLSSNH